jgi:hypothetical protein
VQTIGRIGLGALIAAGAGFVFWGDIKDNISRWRATLVQRSATRLQHWRCGAAWAYNGDQVA